MRPIVYLWSLCLPMLLTALAHTSFGQPANYRWDRFGMGGVTLTASTPVPGTWSNTTQASGSSTYYLVEWDSYWNKWSNTATPFQSEFTLFWGGGSSGGPNGVLNTPTTAGKYYTLQIKGLAYANRNAVLMETDAMPQSFHAAAATAVSAPAVVLAGSNVAINVTLAGPKSPQERVFVRYSTNGFTTSKLVEAIGTGSTWSTATATIPAADNIGGTTMVYYAYTTTVAATAVSDHDLIALKLGNNGGSNYSYVVQTPQYRSGASGVWSNPASWEYSLDGGSTWSVAITTKPSADNAGAVFIRSGHTMQLDENVTIDQLVIEGGGVLERNAGSSPPLLTIADGPEAADIVVKGNGILRILNNNAGFDYIHAINYVTGAKILIESNGMLEVNNSAGSAFWQFAAEPITKIEYQHQAVFYYNVSGTLGFSTSSVTYFPDVAANVIPVFRVNANIAVGAGTNTTINGLLEISSGKTLTWQNAGIKVLRNGITGSGNIIQDASCGQIRINGNTSVLGGGALNLNSIGLAIESGTCTLVTNKVVNSGTLTVNNGATLNAQQFSLTNATAASFVLSAGATLITAHANGVNGSIQLTGSNSFQDFANYTFNGSTNQSTGSLMGAIAFQITISNSGSAGNNVVSLSNNAALPGPGSTTIRNLILSSGLLQVGGSGFLHMEGLTSGPTYASITGSGGNFVSGANGGTLFVKGPANINSSTSGWPTIYNITIQENGVGLGVNFISNATITNTFTINNQGFVNPNAPRLASGSTLVYNSGGTYNRSIEWGQPTPLAPGYPHHVLVQNGTTLNLATTVPTALEIGGDLTIGSSTSSGVVNMNTASIPLNVKGNLSIGNGATTGSSLTLSSVFGGDLWLSGNFTRYPNNYYTDNNRAIFFKGSGNSSINTPSAPPATIADPTLQDFSYCFIDKANATNLIILNTPVGITESITFTKGIVETTSHLLIIKNTLATAVQGGSIDSYVNGPLRRYVSTTSGSYLYPLGKSAFYKPALVVTTTNQSAGDYFTGEFYHAANATPTISSDTYGVSLIGILRDDYWQIDRSGTSKAMIALSYDNGMTPWRTASGSLLTPCANCNVAVVKRDATTGSGNWNFTIGAGLFSSGPGIPQYRSFTDNGLILSSELNAFSPFTLGYSFNTILGTLPVKLLSFTGTLHQNKAALQWTIDDPKDLRYIEVQHSKDGRIFSGITQVLPNGSSYEYYHTPTSTGPHYFRLVLHEKNGQSFISQTVLLMVGAVRTDIVGLQTTIIARQAVVNIWSAKVQNAEATVYNNLGQPLGHYQTQLQNGQQRWSIPVSVNSPGLYYLQVQTADGIRKTLRFLKQ